MISIDWLVDDWVLGSGSVEEAPKFYFPPQGAFRSLIIRTRLANPPSPSAASSKTTPGPVRRSWTPMASWCPPFLIWGTPCRYKREHLAKLIRKIYHFCWRNSISNTEEFHNYEKNRAIFLTFMFITEHFLIGLKPTWL